jgi:hypothetical protein
MKIEFLCRYGKVLPKETQDTLDAHARSLTVIDNTGELTFERAKAKIIDEDGIYEYGAWVMDLDDVSDFNYVDPEHTCVLKRNGLLLILKIDYQHFKMIYSLTTGKVIAPFTEFMELPEIPKPKIKKNDKKNLDGI